jgi:hypothetical protein
MNIPKETKVVAVIKYAEPKEEPVFYIVTRCFDSIEELQNYLKANIESFSIRTGVLCELLGYNILYCALVVGLLNEETNILAVIDFDRRTLLN